QQALDALGLPEDLVTEIAGRLRSQHKLLGKIIGVMCPPIFGCRTNAELCRVRGWTRTCYCACSVRCPSAPGSSAQTLRSGGAGAAMAACCPREAATRRRWQWTCVGDDSVCKKYCEQLGVVGTWWSGQEQ